MYFNDLDAADREIAKVSTVVMFPKPVTVRYWYKKECVEGCEFEESPDGLKFYWYETVVIGQVHDPDDRQQTVRMIIPGVHPAKWLSDDKFGWVTEHQGKWQNYEFDLVDFSDIEESEKRAAEWRWKQEEKEAEKTKSAA